MNVSETGFATLDVARGNVDRGARYGDITAESSREAMFARIGELSAQLAAALASRPQGGDAA